MAAAGKFKLNRATVGQIMKHDPGLIRAIDEIGVEIGDKAGPTATVDHYTTDRHVAGVVVGAAEQAKNGVATKAAQKTVADNTGKPFKSRAQWRFYARSGRADFHARAHATTGGWSSLPSRAPKRGGGSRA